MKTFISFFIIITSLLTGKESSFQSLSQPKEKFSEEKQKQFFYLSGGLTLFCPTVSVGYQIAYGSFGSDISVSESFLPLGGSYNTSFPSFTINSSFSLNPCLILA